jgi:hypothetical protein
MFNKFLKEMKSDFIGTRYSAFWSKVVGESISLVTSAESGDSSVSQEEAKQVQFLIYAGGYVHVVGKHAN